MLGTCVGTGVAVRRLLSIVLHLNTVSVIELGVHYFYSPQTLSPYQALKLHVHVTTPGFYVSAGNLNPCPYVDTENFLYSEPSL